MSDEEEEKSGDESKPQHVPEDIDELLRKEKNKNISYDERDELFSFLETVDDIQNLVKSEPYNFTDTDYNRMLKAKVRHGSRQRAGKALKDPAGALKTDESTDFGEFVTQQWSQARDIGTKVVQKYTPRASELGYYDEDLEMVDMRTFTEDALDFFIEERPKVRSRKQWLAAFQASFNAAQMIIQNQKRSIEKLTMFILKLAEQEDIPVEELAPVRGILNEIAGGEIVAGKEGREREGREAQT